MKVKGLDNIFVGGEKAGLFVGHTEAITTGSLAGHNAVRYALGMPLLILPRTTVLGDLITFANYQLSTKEGRRNRYTFAGAEYFKRMVDRGMYTTDIQSVKGRIEKLNLTDVMNQKLV